LPGPPVKDAAAPRVIGFVGHFGPWIDLDLLDRVAAAMPQARLMLVGSIDPAMKKSFARLVQRSNVDYVGSVPHVQVPSIVAGFDVGLMPFRLSDYTRAVNPVKLYEYAAQNVPVVSTAFSPDVDDFSDWIDVCHSDQAFVEAVANRAEKGLSRPIRWIAEAHTWRALAERLANLIDESTPDKTSRD
jgi:glycosyltransferase involved in cell wall biosynthesis